MPDPIDPQSGPAALLIAATRYYEAGQWTEADAACARVETDVPDTPVAARRNTNTSATSGVNVGLRTEEEENAALEFAGRLPVPVHRPRVKMRSVAILIQTKCCVGGCRSLLNLCPRFDSSIAVYHWNCFPKFEFPAAKIFFCRLSWVQAIPDAQHKSYERKQISVRTSTACRRRLVSGNWHSLLR